MDKEDALVAVDMGLAALGVLPSLIASIEGLISMRKRIKAGEQVTREELRAAIDELAARSARIQAA